MRILPVYLLIDSSESMVGPPIEAINRGIEVMIKELKCNPYALETVWLSVITFDSIARVLVPLTEICNFHLPEIQIKPGTSLGLALQLLLQQIQRDSKIGRSQGEKSNYRPLVFILTDGQPTDSFTEPLEKLRTTSPKPANIYGVGCGNEVDFEVLRKISDITYYLDEMSPEKFAKFFIWMSASVQSVSQGYGNEATIQKVPLPTGFCVVNDDNMPECPDFPLQVFIHSVCSSTKKKYMTRFVFFDQLSGYIPVEAYPLPNSFFNEGSPTTPPISSDLILGVTPCPYCHNEGWGQCGNCQTNLCFPDPPPRFIICPSCGNKLAFGEAGSFDINRSSG